MKQKLITIIISLVLITVFSACGKKVALIETEEVLNKVTEPATGEAVTDEITDPKNDAEQEVDSEETTVTNLTPINENLDYNTMGSPILLPPPPFSYYASDKAVDNGTNAIRLTLKSTEPNNITDDIEWFIMNNLPINNYKLPEPSQDIVGNFPSELPSYWNGLIITSAFYDDSYIYCVYGSDYPEGYMLTIYDAATYQVVYTFDFSNYRYSPEYIEEDYAYIQQKINWTALQNNILYISHSHTTYAKSSNNMNAYITAIDLTEMSILWRTDSLVCNSNNFLIMENVILCGYGFTDEPDYLYQIDLNTGKVLEKTLLKTAATFLARQDNKLYVRTYNTNYVFDIVEEK